MMLEKRGVKMMKQRGQVVSEYFILFAVVALIVVAAIAKLRGGEGFVSSLQDAFRTVANRMGQ